MAAVTPDMIRKVADTVERLGVEGYSVEISTFGESPITVQMSETDFKLAFDGCEVQSREHSREFDRFFIFMDDVEFFTLIERPVSKKVQRVRL